MIMNPKVIHLMFAKKSFNCRLCRMEFPSTSSLKVHLKKKHLDAAVKCHLCAKKFFSKRGVREHMKSHNEHQIVEPSVSLIADTGDNITADTEDTITEVIFEDSIAVVEQIVTQDGQIEIPVEGFGTEVQDVYFSLVEFD